MSDDDIKVLFERIAHHFAGADEGARGMFQMLVATALRYRDLLVHAGGAPLTVDETKVGLDAFMKVLQTHEIPAGLPPRIHELVVMWLQELKEKIHN
jgi:hypothetical protein